jgi:hypothetical protein
VIFLPVPARATELNIGSLTVIRYGLGHRKAAHEAVAVCWRQYGWSVIVDGAVIVCYTCVLVCCASVSTRARAAARASSGAGQAPGSPSRTSSIRASGAASVPLAGDRRTSPTCTARGVRASSRGTGRTRRAGRASGNGVTNAVTLSTSATAARTRSGLTADAPARLQTGPVGARQARKASYEKGWNTAWHLEHGGLRVFDSSNLRAKARTVAVETISAQPWRHGSWRQGKRQPWSQPVLRILRVRERILSQRVHVI